jgi:two-component system nitrate/nitrite sensor histidine kinase NarX
MQSYRLLAAVPLTQDDQPLIDEMERTASALSWKMPPSAPVSNPSLKPFRATGTPSCSRAETGAQHRNRCAGRGGFVSRIDALVSAFDQTTELRIDRVVMVHRAMALFMGCC